MKSQRHLAIRKIILNEKVSSQEELLQKLNQQGFDLTQATVSRDLKEMQAGKKADPEKGSIFSLPDQSYSTDAGTVPDHSFLTAAIRSIHFANKLGVIKTLPGYAHSIAIAIDKAVRFEIIGTIAGDDTILLIPEEGIHRNSLKKALKTIFPGLEKNMFFPAN